MSGATLDLNSSVTQIGGSMIVTLSDNMTDERIHEISDVIIQKAYESDIAGAVLNFAMVSMIDTYIYKTFEQVSRALTLFGVKVVWVGLSPGVVCAMIDCGIEPDCTVMSTALTLEQGLEALEETKGR
ncbi:MAG TPA: STAS domain-containing protein [Eubacteriales bacterium]|nr:STAS domain-containing protein [Eubacteriales bacterium]